MPGTPSGSIAEQLVERFRAWERRGRGWSLYQEACALEPPFRPFPGHYYIRAPFVDDGLRPGPLGARLNTHEPTPNPDALSEDEPEPEPCPALAGEPSEIQVLLPEGFRSSPEAAEQFLSSLSFSRAHAGFELIGTASSVSLQLTCRTSDQPQLVQQLQGLAPSAALLPRNGFLASQWYGSDADELIVDLGLSREFVRPLRGLRTFSVDPAGPIIASLSALNQGEVAVIQCLFQGASAPWPESILRAVHDNEGKPFGLLGPDLTNQAREKIKKALFACRLRVALKAGSDSRRMQLLRLIMGALAQFGTPVSNELIALDREGWEAEDQEEDLLFRVARRAGMLLNLEELSALVHLPSVEVAAPKFERLSRRTKAAPGSVRGDGVLLGVNEHMGQRAPVRLSTETRLRHVYVVGGTGTGKSTLLLNLALGDIEEGRGIAVLDPHGSLVDAICAQIPESRIRDVVLLNPADVDYPIGFNILSAHSELEKTLLSSDLVAIFRRLSTSWGDQMTAVLGNAILAFLESEEGGTLPELRRFLVDPSFRTAFLRTVGDDEVVYFWQKEFPLLRGSPQAPLLTRLDAFLRPKLIRNMVSQRRSSLDFRRIMDDRKILLCKLSQGAIGEENAYLLGALIVAKLQQLASSRQELEETRRTEFYLYLDEFQHFITPSVSALLSGVRKYRMGLILAHQNLTQLGQRADGLIDSVLANAGTRICFRLGDADAKQLSQGFSFFEPPDFQNLGLGEAIVRVDRAEADFNLRTAPARGPSGDARMDQVIRASREQWATPRVSVAPTAPPAEPAPLPPKVGAEVVPVPIVATPPIRKERKAAETPPSPGRGGAKHKYLQQLIKKLGEERGYRAVIEQAVLGGHGSVDVALEQGEQRIAFEIAVTTPIAHELQNIQKCLASGFDPVVVVAADPKALVRLKRELQEALLPSEVSRLSCLAPEEIPQLLDRLAPAETASEVVAGFQVDVDYASSTEEDKQGRMERVREIITKSLRRNKPSG